MKILFVVGGSYKAFYLNNIHKYKKLDLIIFQENILYEYDYYNENFGDKIITNEMIALSKRFNCKIIAKITTNLFGIKNKELLFCDKNGVKIVNNSRFIKLFIKNRQILISNYFLQNKSDYFIYFFKNKSDFFRNKIYNKSAIFVCDKFGVDLYFNKFTIRKFRKICYFSLNF